MGQLNRAARTVAAATIRSSSAIRWERGRSLQPVRRSRRNLPRGSDQPAQEAADPREDGGPAKGKHDSGDTRERRGGAGGGDPGGGLARGKTLARVADHSAQKTLNLRARSHRPRDQHHTGDREHRNQDPT
jgi:hypothetical protein